MVDCPDNFKNQIMITGITGGIGSGKSSAAEFLAHHFSVTFLSADNTVHDLLEPGKEGWQAIKKINPLFILRDQTINKPLLRRTLFEDSQLREEINASIHPLVKSKILAEIDRNVSQDNASFFLVEVPLLFEANWQDMFNNIILVYASEEKCVNRIVSRDNVSVKEAKRSLKSQWSLTEKAELADYVVDNSGPWSDTELQLVHIGNLIWGNSNKKQMV